LSPSAQDAIAWGEAALEGANAAFSSEALLVGIVRAHDEFNEVDALLQHYGHPRDELWAALTRVSPIEPEVASSVRLDTWPRRPFSDDAEGILREAFRLADAPSPRYDDGLVHVPHLFGAVLTAWRSGAYGALVEVLGDGLVLGVETRYEKFLAAPASVRFDEFLDRVPPGGWEAQIAFGDLPPEPRLPEGRAGELGLINSTMLDPSIGRTIVLLTGERGVGKTALAVTAAHRLASTFPGGQFYAS